MRGLAGRIRLGASPRATQALLLAGKVLALAGRRRHLTRQDVIDVAQGVMAHRLLIDLHAAAEGLAAPQALATLIANAREMAAPRVSRWTRNS